MVPDEVLAFGREAAARLRDRLGARFVGAYFVGSVALGDYVPGHSDIDIVALAEGAPSAREKTDIVDALSHPTLPCPTRGLEFVLYERRRVEVATREAAFEINLNSGPAMATHIGFDASREPRFWFVIDRAIANLSGVSIDGPPPSALFAPVPKALLLRVLSESMAWHRAAAGGAPLPKTPAHETLGFSSVLNACRAWRYAEEGVLGSKADGAHWAGNRWADPATIETALRLRGGEPGELPGDAIAALVDHVEGVLTDEIARPE